MPEQKPAEFSTNLFQILIDLIEKCNVNFVQRVSATKLIELMMNFVKDQSTVVVGRIVSHNVQDYIAIY